MKNKLVFGIALVGCLSAFSQTPDSLRIESLKQQLLHLKDSARVDCLNDIAREFAYLGQGKRDSMYFYAAQANKEAVKLGYQKGLGFSLLDFAGYEVFVKKDLAATEKYVKQAIEIGERSNNPDLLGWAYLSWVEVFIRKNDLAITEIEKKALSYFQKAGDEEGEAEVSNWLCSEYSSKGEYEEAFPYCERSVVLSKKKRTHNISWGYFLYQFALSNMAELHEAAGDYETAMGYLQELDQYTKDNKAESWDMPTLIADLFCQMGKYDSASVYMSQWVNNGAAVNTAKGHQAWGWGILGQIYLNQGKYDKAIDIFKNWSDTLKKYHALGAYATTGYLIATGQAYAGKKQYATALKYGKQGLHLAERKSQRPEMMKGYQLLSTAYHQLGKNDSAYTYLLKYTALKDSVQNRQFLLRLKSYRREAEDERKKTQLGFLIKDNKIKQQELRQEVLFKNTLFALLLILFTTGIFVFRNFSLKRKNERLQNQKQQAELQERATRLEMQALRAQMNPHFIFNCLNSINSFILENETEIASDYLTRFSRLIRMVLTNSEKPLITLDEELKMLKLYLDMERLRFKNAFDYAINYTNDVETESVLVPPLLLQPFCENAIWHGLMHKEGQGHLSITIDKKNKLMYCIITDDGVGRGKAAELRSKYVKKEKSMGLKITNERLAALNEENGVHTYYEMEDVMDENGNVAGTRVVVKIKPRQLVDETA